MKFHAASLTLILLLGALHLRQRHTVQGATTYGRSPLVAKSDHTGQSGVSGECGRKATSVELKYARFKRSIAGPPLPEEDVHVVVVENSESGSTTMTSIPEELTESNDTIEDLTLASASARSAHALLDLISDYDSYLPEDYNKLEIPRKPLTESDQEPATFTVWISLKIASVLDIDELRETMHLQMESVVSWFDWKIRNKNNKLYEHNVTRTLDILYLDRIWHPDLYLENLVSMANPKFIGEPVSLRLRPNMGEVFYKARVSPVVKCQFTFAYYPADTQKCQFILRSYSYQSSELELVWLRSAQLSESVVANFELFIETSKQSNITEKFDTLDVTYDILKFTITARRKLSYHLIQTYLPSSLFIIITWLCFLLPPSMLEARMGISMTTLLTLTAMFASVRSNAPVVSYVKAIDIWMVGCIFFVFSTLAEFAAMIWIRHNYEKQLEHQEMCTDVETKALISQEAGNKNGTRSNPEKQRPPLYVLIGRFIDKYAVIAYSLAFISFTALYWSWLLINAEYFSFMTNKSEIPDTLYEIEPPNYATSQNEDVDGRNNILETIEDYDAENDTDFLEKTAGSLLREVNSTILV